MSPFDYLVPLIAILVGLALADLVSSFHRLLRARRRVRWDWYVLACAILMILMTLEVWWGVRSLGQIDRPITIGLFLPFIAELVLLSLLAAAALPDEVPPGGLDLRGFYWENAAYFWNILALLTAMFVLHRLGLAWFMHGAGAMLRILPSTIPNFLLIAICISLAFWKRSWWHSLWLAIMPVVYLWSMLGRPLA
jgi:hypothetical protein